MLNRVKSIFLFYLTIKTILQFNDTGIDLTIVKLWYSSQV